MDLSSSTQPQRGLAREADAGAPRGGARSEGGGDARLIAPARDIIQPDSILAEIQAAKEAGASSAELRQTSVTMLRQAHEQGLAVIRERFDGAPQTGRAVRRSIAFLTDEIVRVVVEVARRWLHPLPNPTTSEKLSIIAVGGYGRFEMAPHSDVDLLFLTPYKQTPWGESLIESVLYILWDLRLKVGHSVRAIDECLRQAKADVTVRTALLEQRFITGDAEMAERLTEKLWKDLFRRSGPEFVEAKLSERDDRHARHGASRFLLEPNIKESKGGLRDLQTLFWIAKYLYNADTPADLLDKDVFSAAELEVFDRAESFLWTVRCHLHFLSGRANEQLTFDMQIEIADRMGYADADGQRGVEWFMRDYFTHAKHVGELTRIFISALEARHVKRRPGISALLRAFAGRGDETSGLRLADGRLTIGDDAHLSEDPKNILRLFDEAIRTGARTHPDALRMVAGRLDLVDDALRADQGAHELFLGLLTSDDPGRALRRMNETGFLGAFLPEWGRIVAMMQFNMYHHYTVDEHTIHAVEILNSIERGELVEDLPVASDILKQGVDRMVLRLALLLHDIGKGRPEDHSILGAELARTICARLGLDDGAAGTIVWLVRHHLLMADVAQKRDISDPATVREFAAMVRSPDRLKLLLVLTVCDIRAVGPGVWNNWKAQLLRTLYWDTRDHLTAGAEMPNRAERVQEAQAALRTLLKGWSPEQADAEIARHYAPFWLGLDTEAQRTFAMLGRKKDRAPIESKITDDPARDATRACFYLEDHPGIFARIAGALAVAGANVVDARSFTSRDGFAMSAFWIQAADGAPYDNARLPALRKTIKKILSGEVIAREALSPKRKLKKREGGFHVPTRIVFDNNSSDIFTVIEVEARDRAGLLHDLTKAIAACNVSIFSAVIATYGEQAVDVFYVKDLFGLKIRGGAKMKTIKARLKAAIDASAPDTPA